MRRITLLVLVGALVIPQCFAQPIKDAPLTYLGLGSIRIGMSQAQIKRLGFAISEEPSGTEGCAEATLNGFDNVLVMLEDDRVTRVSALDASIKTQSGISVGASEREVKRIYGRQLQIKAHTYVDDGHYMVAISPSGKYAIMFETDGSRVTAIHAGRKNSAQYVEGCL